MSTGKIEREYAFNFLYHLSLPEFEDLREKLAGDDGLFDEHVKNFENSYVRETDWGESVIRSDALSLIKKTLLNYSDCRKEIEGNLDSRKFERLDRVDVTLLLLGTAELTLKPDLQEKHSRKVLKDYVSLAKRYGSEYSFAFVNGVLDAIYNRS